MIPKPNLDDRTFQDIVDEALRLIPQYCPDWNNHNPSDPGITLVELFAWMTEMMLYRLNRVPEKNLLTFLELMGVEPAPPRPAQTVLSFKLNEKADRVLVPPRTRVETRATAEDRPVVFETDRPLVATTNTIASVCSQHHDQYVNHSGTLERPGDTFDPFLGTRAIERFLYLCDERFQFLEGEAMLTVEIEVPGVAERDVTRLLVWSLWDGERWAELPRAPVDVPANIAVFEGPVTIAETEVDGKKGYWVRAQLAEVPDDAEETVIETIRARVEVRGEGIRADHMYSNPAPEIFTPLDQDRNLLLLGKEPTADSAFYLAADSLFDMRDATVKLEVDLVEPTIALNPVPSAKLQLAWEFHDGKKWRPLGRSGPGVTKPVDTYGFEDSTEAFARSGVVRFRRPRSMKPTTVQGVEARWVRCRIVSGDYGVAGTYELDGDRWVWRDERPLRPPVVRSLALKFQEDDQVVEHVVSWNDFRYEDHSEDAKREARSFQPFTVTPEDCPTLYLGLSDPFPHGEAQIYVRVAHRELGGVYGRPGEGSGDPDEDARREQTLVWEYWNGKRWLDLSVEDGTCNLTQSGFLRLLAPKAHKESKRFGVSACWIRARLEMGGYHTPPRIENLLLNTVAAANVTTYEHTILGSCEGIPGETFGFPRGPVLPGESIDVIEPEPPSEADARALRSRLGEDAVTEHEGGWLVRWERVDSFFESDATSRHYMRDVVTGRIRFGDGRNGRIPPKGEKSIRARIYQVGGGEQGNVAAHSLQVLRKPIAYVDKVTNPYPAVGGANLEPVEQVMRRGPYVLKSRNRAVTAEDFEWLARAASPSVARVKCLPAPEREGEVVVIVVPHVPRDHPDFMNKPIPSLALLRHVKRKLNEHRLITTVLHVLKPRFVEFDVEVEVYRRGGGPHDRLRQAVDQSLKLFCHPLVGGRDRQGWPFGRSIYKVDLFHVVEEVRDVDLVHRIRLHDVRAGRDVDYLRVADDELIFLRNVEVTERSREQII